MTCIIHWTAFIVIFVITALLFVQINEYDYIVCFKTFN